MSQGIYQRNQNLILDPFDPRKAYGLKTFKTLELALYHNLGVLPEPEITHRFF
jgi:hypothetical protein